MNKTTIPGKYLDRVFAQPQQWGHRGDPMLWDWLRDKLQYASEPLTAGQWLNEIREHLKEFGVNLAQTAERSEEHLRIKAFDRGEMSGMCVSSRWWLTRGLPLLEQRLADLSAVLANKNLLLPSNVQQLFFIGDIHAQYDKLLDLLRDRDYIESHPENAFTNGRLVFLGDLIDNKPQWGGDHLSVLTHIKGLVTNKLAYCVLGNHEFNAIGWSLKKPDGSYCRDRNKSSNRSQHQLFLEQVGEDSQHYHSWINWFKTLPLFIDFADVRVIHACWHQPSIDKIRPYLNEDNTLKDKHWPDAFNPDHELYQLCETLLKGPEMALPAGYSFTDKNNLERHNIRIGWWKPAEDINSFRDLAVVPTAEGDCIPDLAIDEPHLQFNQPQEVPVVVGHYTLNAAVPYCLANNVICVDFNAAFPGNALVGYAMDLTSERSAQQLLNEDNFYALDLISLALTMESGVEGILGDYLKSLPEPIFNAQLNASLNEQIMAILCNDWSPLNTDSQRQYQYFVDDIVKLAAAEKQHELTAYLYFSETYSLKVQRRSAPSICRNVAVKITALVESQQAAHSPTYDHASMTQFIAKAKGSLLGLALGDALGTTLEFKSKDSYRPLTDMVGGGPFHLKAGQWTDDTSMALCLADSLLAVGEHNAEDQMQRYHRWRDLGENSVTGKCFDIGNTVSNAINEYLDSGNPNAGSHDSYTAGNGSLMRFAPVAIFFSPVKNVPLSELLHNATGSSIVTHAEPRAVEACQIMAWLLHQIFNGEQSKSSLFSELSRVFSDLSADSARITAGSFLDKQRTEIHGSGFVVDSLEAALWCFTNSEDFATGALLAANLGDDADTTAAIYGQLAGAFYGIEQLPAHWLDKLAWREKIEQTAEFLALAPPLSQLSEVVSDCQSALAESDQQLAINKRLFDHIYQYNMILRYHWMADQEIQTTPFSPQSASVIPRFNYLECLRYITALIRGDRFNDGLLRNAQRNGDSARWAKRLIALYQAQAPFQSDDGQGKWDEPIFSKASSDKITSVIKSGKLKIRN